MSPLQQNIARLIRYRWLMLCTMGVTVASGLLFTWKTVPVYQATARLQIHFADQKLIDLLEETSILRSGERLETELEILKSRVLAEDAVRRLGYQLQLIPAYNGLAELAHRVIVRLLSWYNGLVTLVHQAAPLLSWVEDIPTSSLPELAHPVMALRDIRVADSVAAPETYTIRFTPPDAFVVESEDESVIGQGNSGRLFDTAQVSFRLESTDTAAGDTAVLNLLPLSEAIEHFQQHVTAAWIRGTEILTIEAQAVVPELARDMAAALAEAYIAFSHQQKTQEATQALAFIEQQLASTRATLQASENALSRFKGQKGLVTLDVEVQASVGRLTQSETSLKQTEGHRQEVEAIQRRLQGQGRRVDGRTVYALGNSLGSPTLEGLAQRLTAPQITEKAMSLKYHDVHPRMHEVQEQIAQVQQKMQGELAALIADLSSREAALRNTVQEYEARLTNLPQAEQELVGLMRQAQISEKVYTFLLQKQEELRIVKASTLGNVRIIDPPVAPQLPALPNRRKNLLFAAGLGLLLGVGAAFLMEHSDDSIRTVEEAEQHVKFPLLGVIPELGSSRRREKEMVQSMAAEGYKSLRTNLRFVTAGAEPRKKLAITSPQAGDGKSTVAANLAMCLGALGYKTLLIDADLRRPSLHQTFGVPRAPGLAEVLREATQWHDALQTVQQNLDLLPAGDAMVSASEWLDSQRMQQLIATWEKLYDYVLFDVPAVVAVTDPVIIGAFCQGVLFVVRAHTTSSAAIRRAQTLLETAHVPVMGTVLNGLKVRHGNSYYDNVHTYYARSQQ